MKAKYNRRNRYVTGVGLARTKSIAAELHLPSKTYVQSTRINPMIVVLIILNVPFHFF